MCVEYCIVCARSQCAYIYRLHCSLSRCLIECTVCILYPHGLYCSMFCVYWKCACSLLFYFSFVSWVFCLVLFCSVLLLLLLYGKFRLRAVSLTCSNHFPLIEYFFSFCSFFTSSSFSCSRICCVQKTLFVLLSLSCSLSIAFGRARFRSSCYFSSLFVVFSSFQFDHVLLFLIYMLKQFFFLLFFSLLFLFSL